MQVTDSEKVTLNYNFRDSVEVSFETASANVTGTYLSLWYYLPGKPWTNGYNTSVPANGTTTVNLNILQEAYYAQFNYDIGDNVQYLSCFFNVDYNTTQEPVTWGQSAAAAYSSSMAAATSTAPAISSIASTTSAPSSTIAAQNSNSSPVNTNNSSTSSSGLGGGAIAGIVVGLVVALLAVIGIGFLFWRRQKKSRSLTPPNDTTQHFPVIQELSDSRIERDLHSGPGSNQAEKPLDPGKLSTNYAELAGEGHIQELP